MLSGAVATANARSLLTCEWRVSPDAMQGSGHTQTVSSIAILGRNLLQCTSSACQNAGTPGLLLAANRKDRLSLLRLLQCKTYEPAVQQQLPMSITR